MQKIFGNAKPPNRVQRAYNISLGMTCMALLLAPPAGNSVVYQDVKKERSTIDAYHVLKRLFAEVVLSFSAALSIKRAHSYSQGTPFYEFAN